MIGVDGPDAGSVTAGLERSMKSANRAVGRDLANVARKAQVAGIRAGGRGSLSGMHVKLTARTKVFAGAARITVEVRAHPAGPWSIRERGRGPVKAKGKGGRGGRALGIPGHPHRSARGAAGRSGTWQAASDAAADDIARAIAAIYDDALGV